MSKNIVLYHGTFHDGSMWNHWKERPEIKGFTLYTPTLYTPEKPIGTHSLADYVANAQEHLNSLEGPVHLVGWSMGATVAQHIGIKNRERIKSTQLISPTAPYGSVKGIVAALPNLVLAPKWVGKTLKAGFLGDRKDYIPSREELNKALFNQLSEEEQTQRYDSLLAASPIAGFQEYFWHMDINRTNLVIGPSPWGRVYVGKEDKLTPPEMAKEVAKTRRASLKQFPGKGHCLPYEPGNQELLEDIITYAEIVNNVGSYRRV